MIPVEIDYLDGEITVSENEPSTFAECVELLGSESACVEEITSNLRYRNKYPRVYKAASAKLQEVVPREIKSTKTLADGTVKNVYDSEMNHLRAAFKADPKATTAAVTAEAQDSLLYLKGERTSSGGKIAASAMNGANEFFARGDDAVETAATQIEALVPGYSIGRDADKQITPESLARGIQALNKHLQKQAKQQADALLSVMA